MVKRILLCVFMMLCIVCSVSAAPADTGNDTGTSTTSSGKEIGKVSSKPQILIAKDKDGNDIEIKDGLDPKGKIYIGVGQPKETKEKDERIREKSPQPQYDKEGKPVDKAGKSIPMDKMRGMGLVENMRALKPKIPYVFSDFNYTDNADGTTHRIYTAGTGCVVAVSTACLGTPYGSVNPDGTGGVMSDTEQLIARARELGQLVDIVEMRKKGDYEGIERARQNIAPGDILIGNNWGGIEGIGHAIMAKLNSDGKTIGTISNGQSGTQYFKGGCIYETDRHPTTQISPWGYLIKSSGYAGFGAAIFNGIYDMGEALNKIIERFSDYSNKIYGQVRPHIFQLIALLAIIDFALALIVSGMALNVHAAVLKILKYGFIYWLYNNWGTIVGSIYETMVINVNTTIQPENISMAAANMCQPHILLQKACYLLKPGFEYIDKLHGFNLVWSAIGGGFALGLCFLIMTMITLFVYMMFAIYMAYVYISVFIYAGLSAVTVPFMTSKFSKFFPEGGMGTLFAAIARMMMLTFAVAIMTVFFDGAAIHSKEVVIPDSSIVDLISRNVDMFTWYMKQCCMMLMFAYFAVKVSDNVSDVLKGRFELG